MNFDIREILYNVNIIVLISVGIISTVLAEVDDKNVNNPTGTTITNSSDGYAVELDNGDSFTVINSGTINSSHTGDAIGVGLEDSSTLTNLTNNGTISGLSSGSDAYGIYTFNSTFTNLTNGDTIKAETTGGNDAYGIYNTTTTINDLTNTGTISAESSDDDAYGIINDRATINSLTNSGTIKAVAADDIAYGILNNIGGGTAPIITDLTNTGIISAEAIGDDEAYGIYNDEGTITNLTNSGTIKSVVADDSAYAIYNDEGTITNLTNTGTISGEAGGVFGYGIYNDAGGTITNLINTGTISGTEYDVGSWKTNSHIVNFNNLQSALTYNDRLPRNYSTIIQGNNYGQLFIQGTPTESSTGDTVYTPFAGNADVGVYIPSGTYTNVMKGMPDANLHSTVSGTLTGDGENSVGTVNWELTETSSGSNNWDLTTSGGKYTYIGKTNTQNAVNQTAKNVGGVFQNVSAGGNFANMTTYDCDLFNGRENCISVGGRITESSATDTSLVLVAGQKINENFRIGGYIDQTINHSHYKDVDLNVNVPLMGAMAVWNENADQQGLQLKLANSFQSNDVTITRAIVGSSELAKGDTTIETQSYIAEASYKIDDLVNNISAKPFGAVRYMKTELDAYTEKDVGAPITYSKMDEENFAAIVGVKAYYQL